MKVRCIKVSWLSSSGLFLSLWPLPLSFDARFVAKSISGRPTNTLQTSYNNRNPALGVLWSWHREAPRNPRVAIIVTNCKLVGIHRFTVIGS